MVSIGYALSSEEHDPRQLVANARRAEESGFGFALISDHYHPWISRQGHSPFVWSVLGGIARATERLQVGTGVTAPIIRMHPAIVAQAAATTAAMMPGRFFLGLGTGERLNEHILGDHWPRPPERLAMLREAIGVIQSLWSGGERSHQGRYYTVEYARLYTLPDSPPPLIVASMGPRSARLAAQASDGLLGLTPNADLVQAFADAGGEHKPRVAKMTVSWAESEAEARSRALEQWPNAAMGPLVSDLRRPGEFEAAARLVREEDVVGEVLCRVDRDAHLERIRAYADAGFEYVYVHQVGGDQEGFMRFYEREILPEFDQRPIDFGTTVAQAAD